MAQIICCHTVKPGTAFPAEYLCIIHGAAVAAAVRYFNIVVQGTQVEAVRPPERSVAKILPVRFPDAVALRIPRENINISALLDDIPALDYCSLLRILLFYFLSDVLFQAQIDRYFTSMSMEVLASCKKSTSR